MSTIDDNRGQTTVQAKEVRPTIISIPIDNSSPTGHKSMPSKLTTCHKTTVTKPYSKIQLEQLEKLYNFRETSRATTCYQILVYFLVSRTQSIQKGSIRYKGIQSIGSSAKHRNPKLERKRKEKIESSIMYTQKKITCSSQPRHFRHATPSYEPSP